MLGQRKKVSSFSPAGNMFVLQLRKAMKWWLADIPFLRICPRAPLSKPPYASASHMGDSIMTLTCLFKVGGKGSGARPNTEPSCWLSSWCLSSLQKQTAHQTGSQQHWPLSFQVPFSRSWAVRRGGRKKCLFGTLILFVASRLSKLYIIKIGLHKHGVLTSKNTSIQCLILYIMWGYMLLFWGFCYSTFYISYIRIFFIAAARELLLKWLNIFQVKNNWKRRHTWTKVLLWNWLY